ncbi:hypothetical protein KQX54_012416 [Cotesia glomerata]|uniref:Uncharacterized protein n=1 Tax=Cotesia glomerata TaxID=32391 RepID=A0AAV7HXF9_COTGL|nr:hypothetical protein KQX54_012416 [Cotesia glomerata]
MEASMTCMATGDSPASNPGVSFYSAQCTKRSACSAFSFLRPTKYLKRCPYFALNIKAQLRLATIYACNITFNVITYKLIPRSSCRARNLDEPETTTHFSLNCSTYQSLRMKLLSSLGAFRDASELLALDSAYGTKVLTNYTIECLKFRSKLQENESVDADLPRHFA